MLPTWKYDRDTTVKIFSRLILLALACSTGAALAQDQYNTNNTFGASSSIAGWDYWSYGDAAISETISWDGTMDASNNPSSGSMKIAATSSNGTYNQAAFRGTFSGTTDNGGYTDYNTFINGTNYAFLDMDINVAASSPSSGGNYGSFQLGFYTGGSGPNQYTGLTVYNYTATTTGWVHIHAPINSTTLGGGLGYITGIWIQDNQGDFDGTTTFWVDNVKLLPPVPVGQGTNNVYYVATNGLDSNPGTNLGAPFLTISHAAQIMIPGDTCYIRDGVYRETLKPNNSGNNTAPITFSAYSNEVATISGADLVTNWTQYSGNIYSATMNWDLGMGYNQVFVDGAMMNQSRYPAMTSTNTLLNPALISVSVSSATTPSQITSSSFTQSSGFWAGCYFVGRAGGSLNWQWGQIGSSSSGSVTVTNISDDWNASSDSYSGQGYILGNLASLNASAEWHYQAGTLYLWTPAGDSPNSHVVEVKHRARAVDLSENNYVVVNGLHLTAGAVSLGGDNCVLSNCEAAYMSHFVLFPWAAQGQYDVDADLGYEGIYVAGSSNRITGCVIHDTAGCGICVEGNDNRISRCWIYNISYAGTYADPIHLSGQQNQVWFNTIANAGRDCVSPFGSDQDIRFNDISFSGLLCHDLGVFYAWNADGQGSQPAPTRIAYNWIHDDVNRLNPGPYNPGLYFDNYCRNFVADHNVIWNCAGDAGIRVNTPEYDMQFYNNTLFDCDDVGTHTFNSPPGSDPSGWPSQYDSNTAYTNINDLFLGTSPASQLVNYGQDDFHLTNGAAAINAGAVVPGYTEGYYGSAPDLGAYEYGAFRWTAGTNGAVGIDLQRSNANLILYCPIGTLLQAGSITGPWTPVPNGAMPCTVTPAGASMFYRVQVE
jgi:hypothetical protein